MSSYKMNQQDFDWIFGEMANEEQKKRERNHFLAAEETTIIADAIAEAFNQTKGKVDKAKECAYMYDREYGDSLHGEGG